MDRLSVIDEMFLRSHQGLGTPIAMQGLWRTADVVDHQLLQGIHAALARGPLGRRVIRSRVPGARPWFRVDTAALPLAYASRRIPAQEVLNWADTQAPNLDPARGPGWRLSATTIDDGGTMVSLVCSHTLADARGLALAVDRALTGGANPSPEQHISDWADARRQWAIVTKGTARAIGGLMTGRETLPPKPPAPQPTRTQRSRPRSAILSVPAGEWDDAAAGNGGTANTLFVAIVAHILWTAGHAAAPIQISLPVDARTSADIANAMTMTEATVAPGDSLAVIRDTCRKAYAHPMTSPAGFPEELVQVLPARLAHKLSEGAGERDALCSNIGELPAALSSLGGHRTVGVATRAVHPGITSAQLDRLRTKVSGYLSSIDDRYTLALVGLDGALFPSNDALRDLALAELRRWNITAQAW